MFNNRYSRASLNKGQLEACDGFFDFLFSDDKEMIISGAGGTGKTHVMGYLINNIIPSYLNTCKVLNIVPKYKDVVMTATTNPAANVLANSIEQDVDTIYSYLRLKVNFDFKTGKSYLVPRPDWEVKENQIIFIDEAFRLDHYSIKKINEGTKNCKIIYVGDDCQTSPINGTCPINNLNIKNFELTEAERNKDSIELQNLCHILRERVKTTSFGDIQLIPGIIDYLSNEDMEKEIISKFKDVSINSRIVSYTNDRANLYNSYIRTLRGLTDKLEIGELVINNSTITNMSLLNEKCNVTLYTDEILEITSIHGDIKKTYYDNCDPNKFIYTQAATLKNNFNQYKHVMIPIDQNEFRRLIDHYKKTKQWGSYYNLKNKYPDLRPKDACTIHKVQGATYPSIYIDLTDLNQCNNPDTAARLLYTAVSRAKERVVFHGELPKKYGRLIN